MKTCRWQESAHSFGGKNRGADPRGLVFLQPWLRGCCNSWRSLQRQGPCLRCLMGGGNKLVIWHSKEVQGTWDPSCWHLLSLAIAAPDPRGVQSRSFISGAYTLHKGLCFRCPVVLPISETCSCSPRLLQACAGRTRLASCPAVLPRGSGDVVQSLGLDWWRGWQSSVCISIQTGRTQAMMAGQSPEERLVLDAADIFMKEPPSAGERG